MPILKTVMLVQIILYLVHAIEQNKITSYGGTASGAGTLGIGGTVVVNEHSK